jgi:hypothetical protein
MVHPDYIVPYGTIGTVLEDFGFVWVKWDKFTGGHDATFDDGRKSACYVFQESIELVTHESSHDAEEDGGGAVFGALHAMGVSQ